MEKFILLSMIFFHIVDDYYLQKGILASMKQKEWWKENAPDSLYKYDYLMALFMHCFSWAFMITLPLTIYIFIIGASWSPILFLFVINLIIHFIVDDLKANQKRINLIQDQSIHLLQIFVTWLLVIYVL